MAKTKTETEMNKLIVSTLETLNQDISSKLDTITNSMSCLLTSIGVKLDTLISTVALQTDNIHQENNIVKTLVTDVQSKLNEDGIEMAGIRKESHAIKVEEHAIKRKNTMKGLWYNKLNLFGQKYKQYRKNIGKGPIYEEWVSKGTFLPKKFRTHTETMSEEERERAKAEGFTKMKEEAAKMKKEAQKADEKTKEINALMLSIIETREMKNVGDKMKELWNEEMQRKMTIIDTEWLSQAQWLRSREDAEGDGDDDEEKWQLDNSKTKIPGNQKKQRKQVTTLTNADTSKPPTPPKTTNNQTKQQEQVTTQTKSYADSVKQPKSQTTPRQNTPIDDRTQHTNQPKQQKPTARFSGPAYHRKQNTNYNQNKQASNQYQRWQPANKTGKIWKPQTQWQQQYRGKQQQQWTQYNYQQRPQWNQYNYQPHPQKKTYQQPGQQTNYPYNPSMQQVTNKLQQILTDLNNKNRSGFDQYPPTHKRFRSTMHNGNFLG